ncbi:sensor histidine kinase [Streptantibioticus cattleyicolor]|uniref:histidine kinase n=1 Tax=Streptantibioticus cattleyicolor (strain ATCC 35852 / DSM 46488 / JCM 4925 / NBRC 14057 / NRRL 8057) TaxID=1003195 RepID=F8JM07_STREN|nr:histidine kinase [Streptantibioticus cattleyicolor]AEW99713.1 two-component system sensor kinase [Streptantibioticus cattleyicolor NRRL 8057 = DSM 46488]CCB71248.1 putative two-component system sensor kinase [Streptantibioticus cattleyicolor NRRL 8057 = DSM 46488]
MPGLLLPLTRAVTYTRWLHMLMGAIVPFVCAMVYPGLYKPSPGDWLLTAVLPVPLVLAAAMVPVVRRAEGLQARLMLFPGPHARVRDDEDPGVSTVASASWSDRVRTGAWLLLRMETGLVLTLVTNELLTLALSLAGAAAGEPGVADPLLRVPGTGWAYLLLVPMPVLVLLLVVTGAGALMAKAARALLGPSVKERLSELEKRTERLLERNHIARELHDTLGHALTTAVVQAGAARAAGDPDFTDRALETIEETGRAALEDLDRVLLVLRETGRPAGARPALDEASRLLDSARSSGARVDAEVTGALEHLPGPVSREAYRMLQEALTNVLRHAGPVPIGVRIAVEAARLRLEVRNPLPAQPPATGPGGGRGLRGIRERAALLGGEARAGQDDGQWLLRVDLPLR